MSMSLEAGGVMTVMVDAMSTKFAESGSHMITKNGTDHSSIPMAMGGLGSLKMVMCWPKMYRVELVIFATIAMHGDDSMRYAKAENGALVHNAEEMMTTGLTVHDEDMGETFTSGMTMRDGDESASGDVLKRAGPAAECASDEGDYSSMLSSSDV